jgi:hypothetical protein
MAEGKTVLQDQNGKPSGKRLAGFISLGIAAGIAALALFKADVSPDVAVPLVRAFLWFSGACFGFAGAEGIQTAIAARRPQ